MISDVFLYDTYGQYVPRILGFNGMASYFPHGYQDSNLGESKIFKIGVYGGLELVGPLGEWPCARAAQKILSYHRIFESPKTNMDSMYVSITA